MRSDFSRLPSPGRLGFLGSLTSFLCVTALFSLPRWTRAIENDYCSSFSWNTPTATSCPPCRSVFDKCTPLDLYWNNDNLCMLGDTIERSGLTPCGDSDVVLLRSANGTFAGKLTLFQTSDFMLHVTFQMVCPFLLRSDLDPAFVPFSAALFAWGDLGLQESPQYVDVFPRPGAYSCLTYAINLKKVCDPMKSTYSFAPLAAGNGGCSCLPGSSPCKPLDLSVASVIFIVPTVHTTLTDSNCHDASTYTTFRALTKDGTGIIKWTPKFCGAATPYLPSSSPPPPPVSTTSNSSSVPPSRPSPSPSIILPGGIMFEPTAMGQVMPPHPPEPVRGAPSPMEPARGVPSPMEPVNDTGRTASPPHKDDIGTMQLPSLSTAAAPPVKDLPPPRTLLVPSTQAGESSSVLASVGEQGRSAAIIGGGNDNNSPGSGQNSIAVIVGAAVGGGLALLILAAGSFVLIKRSYRSRQNPSSSSFGKAMVMEKGGAWGSGGGVSGGEGRVTVFTDGGVRGADLSSVSFSPSLATSSLGSTITIATDGEMFESDGKRRDGSGMTASSGKYAPQGTVPDLMFPIRPELSNQAFPGPFASWRMAARATPKTSSHASGALAVSTFSGPLPSFSPPREGLGALPGSRGASNGGPTFSQIELDQAPEWRSLESQAAPVDSILLDSGVRRTSWSQDCRRSSQDASNGSPHSIPNALASGRVAELKAEGGCATGSRHEEVIPSVTEQPEDISSPFAASYAATAMVEGLNSPATDIPPASHVVDANINADAACGDAVVGSSFSDGGSGKRETKLPSPGGGSSSGGGRGGPFNAQSTSGRSSGGGRVAVGPPGSIQRPSPPSGGSLRSMELEGDGSPLMSPKGSVMTSLQVLLEAAGPSGEVTAAAAAVAAAANGEEVDADELALVLLQRYAEAEWAAEAAADEACDHLPPTDPAADACPGQGGVYRLRPS